MTSAPVSGVAEPASGVTVITGASRGIGAACAVRLAKDQPNRVLVLSYATDRAAATSVAEQVAARGAQVEIVQADVASESDVLTLFEVADGLGPVTGLINNAGMVAPIAPLVDLEAERIQRIVEVNVVGSLLCAREAVRRMSTERGGPGGVVVNLSSRAASFGSPNEFIDYAASKGAIDTMTIGLANEVARQGIRVNAVRPGLIDTELHAAAGQPDRVERLAERVPMGRGGTVDEVAAMVAWLFTDDASYVTGALLDVGGGR